MIGGMDTHLDVIIAGGGMAGMTLALALQSGGLHVALIERQPYAEQLDAGFDGRASAIAYACFRQWNALGVGPAIAERACRMDEIMVTDGHLPGAASRKPLPFFLNFKAEEISGRSGDEPLGYMVENRHVRQVLYDAIRERHINLIVPAGVVDFRDTGGLAEVTLDTGQVLNALTGAMLGATNASGVARFTPDGRAILQVGRDFKLHDLGGKPLKTFEQPNLGIGTTDLPRWVHVSRDGRYVVVLARDMTNPDQAGIVVYERRAAKTTSIAPAIAMSPLSQSVTTGGTAMFEVGP